MLSYPGWSIWGALAVVALALLLLTTITSTRTFMMVQEMRDEQQRQSHCLDVVAQNLGTGSDGGVPVGCPVP